MIESNRDYSFLKDSNIVQISLLESSMIIAYINDIFIPYLFSWLLTIEIIFPFHLYSSHQLFFLLTQSNTIQIANQAATNSIPNQTNKKFLFCGQIFIFFFIHSFHNHGIRYRNKQANIHPHHDPNLLCTTS